MRHARLLRDRISQCRDRARATAGHGTDPRREQRQRGYLPYGDSQVLDSAGEIFAWQHDPEAVGTGPSTVFDDESGLGLLGYSRAVTIRLDLRGHVATLVKSVRQPEGLTAGFTGNAQTTRNGDLFVSWGNTSFFAEFSPSGKLLFNARFPAGISSYRAYRLPWHPAG